MQTQQTGCQTTNVALASLLHTLGVPFMKNSKGQEVRCLNIYTVGKLKKLGYKGMTLAQAAQKAFDDGKPGDVTFLFEKTPLLEKVVEAWEKTAIAIDNKDKEGKGTEPLIEINAEPDEIAAFACLHQKARKLFAKAWELEVPMMLLSDVHKEAGAKEFSVTLAGSFKLVSLNATKETRARVGL